MAYLTDDDEDDEKQPIVIDSGSCWIKSGFAGDDQPFSIITCFVAEKKSQNEEENKENVLHSLRHPIQHGIITSVDDMELLWYHIFENELKIDAPEREILLTDAAMNPKSNRELIIEIMFETFNAKKTAIGV